jgi:hypothetical protein
VTGASGYTGAIWSRDCSPTVLASRRVDGLTAVGEILSDPVDYSGVEAVLEHERARTRDYLLANIARAD